MRPVRTVTSSQGQNSCHRSVRLTPSLRRCQSKSRGSNQVAFTVAPTVVVDDDAPSTSYAPVQYAAPAGRPDARAPVTRGIPVTADLIADAASMFCSLLSEYAYWVEDTWVTGQIPSDLNGTYFRNGPGLQVNNKKYQRHTFDGDGMVLSLAFKNGQAYFRNKFVRTKGFVEEQISGVPKYRSSFTKGAADGSKFFNPFDLNFKNVANTGVLYWAGQLYALWEAGLPHVMNPRTLDTLRESRVSGQITTDTLAGHYRITTEADGSQRWIAFSTTVTFNGSKATFYEFDERGRCLHTTSHLLEGIDISFVHDSLVTENYYVLVMGPIEFDKARFAGEYMTGRCSIAECLKYNEGMKTKVMIFPRPGRPGSKGLKPQVMETVPFFAFHHINAYEMDGGKKMMIDTIAWDEITFSINHYNYTLDYYTGGCRTELYRLVCDLERNNVRHERMMQRTVEFPTMNPAYSGKPQQHSYLLADMVDHAVLWGPGQAIVKVTMPPGKGVHTPLKGAHDVKTDLWYAGPRRFPGEPMFVPRANATAEDDGYLIVAVHNAATLKGEVDILDAQNLSAGPVATIHLPHGLPAGLHGSWANEYLGPDPKDMSVPRWKTPNKIRAL